MSDSQLESYTPTEGATRRRTSVWLWALVLLVAVLAFAAAVWWAGGPAEVAALLGGSGLSLPSLSGASAPTPPPSQAATSAPKPSTTATVSSDATKTLTTLPDEALQRMFAEQLESRVALTDLVAGRMTSLSFGDAIVADTSATVPLVATDKDGLHYRGTMTLDKFNGVWYLASVVRSDHTEGPDNESPGTFDRGVVSAITEQQAEKATQDMISKGILDGGFKVAKVESVQDGPRTATVNVTLSGGSLPETSGALVLVSKVDAGTTYWFVASFEKR